MDSKQPENVAVGSGRLVRPLPAGTNIEYCGMPAVVLHDDGGNKIKVRADDWDQDWYWKFEGVECVVVSGPNI